MNFQPPDPERFGSCLKCSTLIEDSEQSGGICFECHAVDAAKEPAFPIGANEYGGHGTCFGITVRDYFAMRAPSIPFAWFEPVMPYPKPEFSGTRDSSGGFVETNEVEISAWKLEHYKQQCIQWPYAWADLMLAARSA